MLTAYKAGFATRVIATAAHLLDETGALYAFGKAADQIYRRFIIVFADLCVYCHAGRIITRKNIRRNLAGRGSLLPKGFKESRNVGYLDRGLGAVLHGADDKRTVQRLALSHDEEVRYPDLACRSELVS